MTKYHFPMNEEQMRVYLKDAPRTPAPVMHAEIRQRNENFVPRVVAVTVGSTVDFPNDDAIYHNVFSLSKTKTFDLGRYAAGRSKTVRFDKPGIVRVFCDIHSHMSAFILVFAHRFFAVTDDQGRYVIEGVPPGRFAVAAWYEGRVRASSEVVVPPGGGAVDLDFSVAGQ